MDEKSGWQQLPQVAANGAVTKQCGQVTLVDVSVLVVMVFLINRYTFSTQSYSSVMTDDNRKCHWMPTEALVPKPSICRHPRARGCALR